MLAGAVCFSPLDSLPSKTYKRALKVEGFLCFHKQNHEKRKKRHEILDRAMSR